MSRPRILAVDDEPMILSAFRRAVSSMFEVTTAMNAVEAERLLSESAFELITSDFSMPGRNGLEVLKRAKELQPGCRRVLLTAHLPDAVGDLSICHAVLEKPWVNEDLRAALLGLLAPPLHSFGFKPGIDPDRLNQLVDELETEGAAKKLDR